MGCCCSTPQEEQQSLLSKDEDLRSPSSPSSDWRTERERNIQERSQQFQQRHEAARTVSSAMSDEEEVFSEGEGEGEGEEGGGGGGGEIEAHPSVLLQSQVPEREETEEEREKAREEARKLREEAIIQRENASLVDLQTEMLRAGGISKLEETGIHDFIVTTFKKPTYCRYCCGFIFGVYHQGYRCFDCGFPAHDSCRRVIQPDSQLGICYKVMKPEANWQQEIHQIKKEKGEQGEDKEGEKHHRFQPYSFLRPTYCRHCCKFIVGAVRGAICSDCGFPAHMNCSKITQLPCADVIKKEEEWYTEVKQIKRGEGEDDDDEEGKTREEGSETDEVVREGKEEGEEEEEEDSEGEEEKGREVEDMGKREVENKGAFSTPAPQVAHLFETKTFHRPTYCAHCLGFIYGVVNQGVICRLCNYPAHHDCQKVAVANCSVPKPPKEWLRLIKQQKKDEGKGVRATLFGKK